MNKAVRANETSHRLFDQAVRRIARYASDYSQLDKRAAEAILERFQVLAYIKKMTPEQVEERVEKTFGHPNATYWWNPRDCAIARNVKLLLMNICEEQKLPAAQRGSFKGRPVLTEFCRKNEPVLL